MFSVLSVTPLPAADGIVAIDWMPVVHLTSFELAFAALALVIYIVGIATLRALSDGTSRRPVFFAKRWPGARRRLSKVA